MPIHENGQKTHDKNNENEDVMEAFKELNPEDEDEEEDTIIQCNLCPTPKIFKTIGVSRKTAESSLERHIKKFHEKSHGSYGFGKFDFQPVCRYCGVKNPTTRHNCFLEKHDHERKSSFSKQI